MFFSFAKRSNRGFGLWSAPARPALVTAGVAFLLSLSPAICQDAPDEDSTQAQAASTSDVRHTMFGIDSVSAYTSHFSGLPGTGLSGPGADLSLGGAVTFRWADFEEDKDFSLTYTAAYMGRLRYSALDSLDHMFSLNIGRRFRPRWQFRFSAAANDISAEQLLFLPNALSALAQAPASYNDLTNALLRGTYSNAALIPLVSGTQAAVSPALLLYGTRILTASSEVSLGYSVSPRTSVSFSINANRTQELSSGETTSTTVSPGLFETTSGGVGMRISHSVNSRTEIGIDVGSTRVLSGYEDAYLSRANVFINRSFSRRWFGVISGGGGYVQSARGSSSLPQGPQYLASGTIGFKTSANTFLVSAERRVADNYGIAAGTTFDGTGAWNWSPPGSRWQIGASFTDARISSGLMTEIKSWQAGVHVAHALGSRAAVIAESGYIQYSGGLAGFVQYSGGRPSFPLNSLSPAVFRLSIVWTPMSDFGRR